MLPFHLETIFQGGFLWGLGLVTVAALCNAVMDTIAHKWSLSVFSDIWGPWRMFFHRESWKNKYVDWDGRDHRRVKWNILGVRVNKPVQLTDAWHLCKSIMIGALVALLLVPGAEITAVALLQYSMLGIWWNVVFLLFYKRVLIKK